MPSIRVQKVADLIRDEIAAELRDAIPESRHALVTVTAVSLTSDMRRARVHVSIFPSTADRAGILAALQRARGRFRRLLGQELRLRFTPELEFRLDTTAEQSERIERLLKESDGEGSGGGA